MYKEYYFTLLLYEPTKYYSLIFSFFHTTSLNIFSLNTKEFYHTKFIKHTVSHFILVYLLFFLERVQSLPPKINNNYLLMLAISKTVGPVPARIYKHSWIFYSFRYTSTI